MDLVFVSVTDMFRSAKRRKGMLTHDRPERSWLLDCLVGCLTKGNIRKGEVELLAV